MTGEWRERLIRDLFDGRPIGLKSGRSQDGMRASRLLELDVSTAELVSRLWPFLAVISCWADSTAGRYIPELRQSFPDVEILPKGLISTEGCVSIPLADHPGSALALRSHFLEFLPSADSETRLAHEITVGSQYEVVMTTGGGLYRYRTGDWIEVSARVGRCPLVHFIGRSAVCDLVGEKLNDRFVADALERLFHAEREAVSFAVLVPDAATRCYCLFGQVPEGNAMRSSTAESSRRLDQLLNANPYYQQARQLCQLREPIVVFESTNILRELYAKIGAAEGTRQGSLKPVALLTNPKRAANFIRLWAESTAHKPMPSTSQSQHQ